MRRDILAGALGLAAAAIMLYFKQGAPAYKKVEYSPFLFKPELPVSVEPVRIHPASDLIHSMTTAAPPKKGNTYTVPTVNDPSISINEGASAIGIVEGITPHHTSVALSRPKMDMRKTADGDRFVPADESFIELSSGRPDCGSS